MQVKSKDPKHLFSLDNLLDFFFIKRLTLQTVQSNIASCEESMTPALYWKMRWGRKKKQVWRWDRYRNKDWGKKNQGIGRNVEGNNTVWTFLFTQMNNITTLSSGLLSTPARDVHVRQNLCLVTRVTWLQTLNRNFAMFFFCIQCVRWSKGAMVSGCV